MSRILPLLIVVIFLGANIARVDESRAAEERLVASVAESITESAAHMYERLFQQLGVDDITRTKLAERLQPLEQRSIELRQQRREAVESLEDLMKELGDGEAEIESAALNQTLDRLYTADDALRALRGERSRVFRETLSPKQQLILMVMRSQEKWERMHGQSRESEHGNSEEPQYIPQNLPKQARLE